MARRDQISYPIALRWAYVRSSQIELLEVIEADRPKPLPDDATEEAKAAHELAEKEWAKRERARRLALRDYEQKAPNGDAYAKLLEATESQRSRELVRKQYHDAMMKAKEEEKKADVIQRDDQRRLLPIFEAIYRERPHLAQSAKDYHDGRKYRRSSPNRKAQSAPRVAQEAPSAGDSAAGIATAATGPNELATASI